MLHFGAEYTFKDKGLILNIPSVNYQANVTVENIKAEFEIVYSWSGKIDFNRKITKSNWDNMFYVALRSSNHFFFRH
jgi:hypothetical protein